MERTRTIRRLVVLLGVLLGLLAGIGAYTVWYAKGFSYLTNDPKTCINCHIMNEQYAGWTRASHHAVAVCNDCHTPHDFIGKWFTKALNGYHHSVAFTTGRHPDPIFITARNRRVTEGACRSCHADIVDQIDRPYHAERSIECLRCHRDVGHLH